MNIKLSKKILLGILVLISTFIVVSAADTAESEKPTDSSISAKNEESFGKKPEKDTAITLRGAVAVAVIVGIVALIRDDSEVYILKDSQVLLKFSKKIFEWYLNPEVRKCIKKYEDTELGEALTYVFGVLDREESTDSKRVEENLAHVWHYMEILEPAFGCEELRRVLNERDKEVVHHNIKRLTPDNILKEHLPLPMLSSSGMYSICVGNIADFSKDKEKIMQINSSEGNPAYNLKAIVLCDKNVECFTTAYVKQKDGKWDIRSIYGTEKEPLDDDSIISILVNRGRIVNLIYMKAC